MNLFFFSSKKFDHHGNHDARHVCLQSYRPTETVWCNRFTQQKPKTETGFGFSKSITAKYFGH